MHLYENLLNGCETVESQLCLLTQNLYNNLFFYSSKKVASFIILVCNWVAYMVALYRLLSCITEHLTAEIVQLTVSDITRAIEWMKCSYLYVRMKKASQVSHWALKYLYLRCFLKVSCIISVLKTMQYKKGCLQIVLRSIYKVRYRFICKVFWYLCLFVCSQHFCSFRDLYSEN